MIRSSPSRVFYLMILCLLTFFFSSCDPGQSLQIENNSGADAEVLFVFKKGDNRYKFNMNGNSDSLIVELDTTSLNSSWEFQFGLGTWKIQSSLDSLISAVELIEIKTMKSKMRFEGEGQIRKFFESRIAGPRKEVIQIILD